MPASLSSTGASRHGSAESRQVEQAFKKFSVARNEFVNTLANFIDRKDGNVTLEALMKNDVMAVLCCPLAQDAVPGIQAQSLSCLARLSGLDPLLSQVVVSCGVLDGVLASLAHEHAPVQASASDVLSALSGSGNDFARRVLKSGVMPVLLKNVQSVSLQVKEAAVNTLATLIQSSAEHATLVCTHEVLSVLVALLQVQGSPRTLLLALTVCLSHVAAMSAALAEALITQHAVLAPLAAFIQGASTPPDLKAASLNACAQLCRHHEELVNQVANAGVLASSVLLLTDKMKPAVRLNACGLLLQATEKTPELAEVVARAGAPACLQTFMDLEAGNQQGLLAGCMVIGTMGSFKAVTAKALVDAGVGASLISCVAHENSQVAGVAAWALEQLAHNEGTAGPLIKAGALTTLVYTFSAMPEAQAELRAKRKSAVKALVRCAGSGPSLEPLVEPSMPPNVLKHALRRLEPLLAKSPKERQSFVTSGALQRLQAVLRGGLQEPALAHAQGINSLFPADIVAYYSRQ